MKTRSKVAVIGGGIAGCSTLYHLTQEGWSDVVLVERDELTSGTTWHSAAQVTEPPHLTWSTAMFRKRRTENGEQATEAGRDCLEVKAS